MGWGRIAPSWPALAPTAPPVAGITARRFLASAPAAIHNWCMALDRCLPPAMAKLTHYLLESIILGTEVGFSERATEIPDEVTTMMQINALAIESLKRDAKLARRRDPSLTHAQHLNALAAQRFGVRNYHELLQRVGTEVPSQHSRGRIVVIGSTGMGTGKSTILLNLAAQLARLGGAAGSNRVLLVDLDQGPASAASWQLGRASEAAALPFTLKRLTLPEFAAQVESLRGNFDFVLVDLPPNGAESIVGPMADIVLLPTNATAAGKSRAVKWRLAAWPSEGLSARFFLFGARAGTQDRVMESVREIAAGPLPLSTPLQVLSVCLPEHRAIALANSRGELVTEMARPPAAFLDGIAELVNICAGASGQADTGGGTEVQAMPKSSNPSPGAGHTDERVEKSLGGTAHRMLPTGRLAGQVDGLKGMKVIYPDSDSGPNPFSKK